MSISINNTILEKNRIESRELIDNDRIAFLLPFSGG
ncbi:MAG: MoaD/ThiS family protein [Promethearchaeota archaeon]